MLSSTKLTAKLPNWQQNANEDHLSENLSFDDSVKYGQAIEQGARKVDEIRGSTPRKEDEQFAALEEKVRSLQVKRNKFRNKTKPAPNQPTHKDREECRMLQLWENRPF